MRIALLNFPFDNNYGGNLQRFALMRVLENLGHEPEHLFTKLYWFIPGKKEIIKRLARPLLHLSFPHNVFGERWEARAYDQQNKVMLGFYERYVKHTRTIIYPTELKLFQHYDAYIVGSDQVWRKDMSWKFPYPTMFFDWIEREDVKRIAYGVSFGIEDRMLNEEDLKLLTPLYRKFNAVSVRENVGLDILHDYGWTNPQAVQVLDPTLLLDRQVYLDIIEAGNTCMSLGNLFCYILDMNEEKQLTINKIAQERRLNPFTLGIDGNNNPTMEQWLRSFKDAEYVVTDSFHGCVLSIIFNKPFKLMANKRRGISRFESLFATLGVNESSQLFDWNSINQRIEEERYKSIDFLTKSLC